MAVRVDRDKSFYYPTGITVTPSFFCIKVIRKCKRLYINLYERNVEEAVEKIEFPPESRIGDVWFMQVDMRLKKNMEYALEDEKGLFADEYGKSFSGKDSFGKVSLIDNPRRSPVYIAAFDWGNDLENVKDIEDKSLDSSFIYRLHARGFTKSNTSRIVDKGTFKGILEKVDYLKEIGADFIDIMPATEFDEFIRSAGSFFSLFDKEKKEKKEKITLNYWGYTNSLNFAPKASYATRRYRNPVNEYKAMVKSMHEAGIGVIQEFFFERRSISYIIDVLRFWKLEYHIDGFHLAGVNYCDEIVKDPYLLDCKFIFSNKIYDIKSANVISMDYEYMNNMRKYLKGDEGMVPFVSNVLGNKNGYLNFIADVNGFSLADIYRYDYKHNEENGEDNADGSNMNFSWNCGFEGDTKKLQVMNLRKRMYLNAIFLLMISRGAIGVCSGDEVLQSKGGNNNTYCQDNDTSYFNWKLVNKNKDFLEFFREMLDFRRKYILTDDKQKISIHGMQVWKPDFEYYNRQMGVLIEGKQDVYIILNMHWDSHEFSLPTIKRGSAWNILVNTADINLPFKKEVVKVKNQRTISVEGRSCMVLIAKEDKKADVRKKV